MITQRRKPLRAAVRERTKASPPTRRADALNVPETAPAPPADFDAFRLAVSAQYPTMSKRLKQIADHVLANPNDIAFKTVADLAGMLGIAPSALVRFSKSLGYSGFSQMQALFQTRLSDLAPSYKDRIRHLRGEQQGDTAGSLLSRFTEGAIASLRHLQQEISERDTEKAAKMMASSRMIHVMGSRRAFPPAFYLAYSLGRLELPVHLLDGAGGSLMQQASLMSAQDTLVAFSFAPSAKETLLVFERAQRVGARIVVITDAMRNPFDVADVCFEVQEASVTEFRALNATMSLALLLAISTGQCQENS